MSKEIRPLCDITSSATLRCDCNCTMLVVDKIKWKCGDIDYNISMQDSAFYDPSSFINRLKNAWMCLFKKRLSYNDIYTENQDKMIKFIDELNILVKQ